MPIKFQTLIHMFLFYVLVTPIGVALRAFGWNRLALNFDAERDSYWISRPDTGSDAKSMKRQS